MGEMHRDKSSLRDTLKAKDSYSDLQQSLQSNEHSTAGSDNGSQDPIKKVLKSIMDLTEKADVLLDSLSSQSPDSASAKQIAADYKELLKLTRNTIYHGMKDTAKVVKTEIATYQSANPNTNEDQIRNTQTRLKLCIEGLKHASLCRPADAFYKKFQSHEYVIEKESGLKLETIESNIRTTSHCVRDIFIPSGLDNVKLPLSCVQDSMRGYLQLLETLHIQLVHSLWLRQKDNIPPDMSLRDYDQQLGTTEQLPPDELDDLCSSSDESDDSSVTSDDEQNFSVSPPDTTPVQLTKAHKEPSIGELFSNCITSLFSSPGIAQPYNIQDDDPTELLSMGCESPYHYPPLPGKSHC